MSEEVKNEIKRQTVILVFSMIGASIIYLINYPDAWRDLKMSAALKTKRVAQEVADTAQEIADKAGTMYNRERP